jgi:hypothetical protein
MSQDDAAKNQAHHADWNSNAFHLPLLDLDEIIELDLTALVKPS